MTFAETVTNDPIILALIGIVATVITGLFKLLNDNTKALTKVAKSSEKVAMETAKGSREAKQRNGHLGDQNLKLAELVSAQGKDIAAIKQSSQGNYMANAQVAKILSNSAIIAAEDRDQLLGNTQIIKEQKVEHQTVKHKE